MEQLFVFLLICGAVFYFYGKRKSKSKEKAKQEGWIELKPGKKVTFELNKKTAPPAWTKAWFPDGDYSDKKLGDGPPYQADFKWAFNRVFKEIKTDGIDLHDLQNKLWRAEKEGETKLGSDTILYVFRDKEWRWSAFDAFWKNRVNNARENTTNKTANLDLDEMLLRLPMYEIKTLAEEYAIPPLKGRIKKADLVIHTVNNCPLERKIHLKHKAQYVIIERAAAQKEKKYKQEKAGFLSSYIMAFTYGKMHLRQHLDPAIINRWPEWVMHSDSWSGYPACKIFSGRRMFDDPAWEHDYPPHGVGCSCYVGTH